jgi:hypothetical protein
VRDNIVNAVGQRDAIDERTLERLAHHAIDIAVAAVGSEQIEVVAKQRLDMCGAFARERDDRLTTGHRSNAFHDIGIFFKQLDRQPAQRIDAGIEFHFIERCDHACDFAFDLAAIIQAKEWSGYLCHVHGVAAG